MGIAHGYQNWHCRQAGKLEQLKQLRQIALRESGCCPNRAGGDKVDKDCNIIGRDGMVPFQRQRPHADQRRALET
jgi:hypothetical protein